MGNQYSGYDHWPPEYDYEYSYGYLHRSNGHVSQRLTSLVQRNAYPYYGQQMASPYYNPYSYGYPSTTPSQQYYQQPYYSGYYPRAQYALPYRHTSTPLF
ncbi:hypothetical protein INT44_006952 [Umbelopsis vinacea]|uniref:Uncharacterized protein n=1 Tax=Umbelopsis vinacea TaxID=44442 RepID=A0A8H7PIW7_9FUNG|nr:hypothetical protein INT44_006952 [Umbelopsis vinacea]